MSRVGRDRKGDILEMPTSYSNVIWFVDARPTHISRCSRCPSATERCEWSQKKYDSQVLLLTDFGDTAMFDFLKKIPIVPVANFTEALRVLQKDATFQIFNQKRIRYLESKFQMHIHLFKRNADNDIEVVRKPVLRKFPEILNLMAFDAVPETLNGEIENLGIIQSDRYLPKLLTCNKLKACKFSTYHRSNFIRHTERCGIFNVKQIKCKQTAYGNDDSILKQMVVKGIIPPEALTYRNNFHATFDLETLEVKIQGCSPKLGMTTNANLKLLSIAVGSNCPDYEAKCWVRKTMDPTEETRLIKCFIDELLILHQKKFQSLPQWIGDAQNWIEDQKRQLKERRAKWNEFLELTRYKRELTKFERLDVFGYNSSKFDIPCIAAPLFYYLRVKCGKVVPLKKMTSYMSIATDQLCFKDALRFTSPCSYDKFVKQWGATTVKSLWPYSLYTDIQEMKQAKKFPPRSAFKSELRGDELPPMDVYIAAKTEFYRRKLLPVGHPDRIKSMYGFLRYYNLQDVTPLAQAIENCFNCYNLHFDVNSISALSLPGLAMTAMFKNYVATDPLIYSFSEKNMEINRIFRSQIYGGLVNVFRRHVTTSDDNVPHNAKFSPNGNRFTNIIALDFTSMYLTCQGQKMPTSPGILWEPRSNGTFKKNVMCDQHSFKSQQWLCFQQEHGKIIFCEYLHFQCI